MPVLPFVSDADVTRFAQAFLDTMSSASKRILQSVLTAE